MDDLNPVPEQPETKPILPEEVGESIPEAEEAAHVVEEAASEVEEAAHEVEETTAEVEETTAEVEEAATETEGEKAEDGETEAPNPEAVPAAPEGEESLPETPPQKKGFQALLKKWWFWLIVVAVVGGIIIGISLGGRSSSSGSSSSSYSGSSTVFRDPYVDMVKNATNSTYHVTYGRAFDSFFTSPKWSSFTATSGQTVVEFTGGFLYNSSPATATFQFVLDFSSSTMSVEYLEINGVAQNRLMLATFLQKIFESY